MLFGSYRKERASFKTYLFSRSEGLNHSTAFAPVYNFEVIEIPEQDINDVAISSTRIREALLNAEIEVANTFLGYPFFITGKVVHGDQVGRQLGYPTANIVIEEQYKLIPHDGIFAVKVQVAEGEYNGMAYIGNRPTINGMRHSIEVNLFDFDQDVYKKSIRMAFIHFVRHDVKFPNLDELITQIGKDKEDVMRLLGS